MGNASYKYMQRPSVGTGPNSLLAIIPVTQAVSFRELAIAVD